MTTDLLAEARVERDQMTERIVSGLKDRSRYSLSNGVFIEEFSEGNTWFIYRLLKEQSLDAEFGRYEFAGQHPLYFSKEELEKPKRERNSTSSEIIPVGLDLGGKVIRLYTGLLKSICEEREDDFHYGEITKLDTNNVLTLYERICYIGQKVAQGKINEMSDLPYKDLEVIKNSIIKPNIEEQVIKNAVATAKKYLLPDPKLMCSFFRGVIDLTVEVELDYIQKVRERNLNKYKSPIGFGQVAPSTADPRFSSSSKGFGSQ